MVETWTEGPASQTRVSFPTASSSTSHSLTLQVAPFLGISYHVPGSGPGAGDTEWTAQAECPSPPWPEPAGMGSCPDQGFQDRSPTGLSFPSPGPHAFTVDGPRVLAFLLLPVGKGEGAGPGVSPRGPEAWEVGAERPRVSWSSCTQ